MALIPARLIRSAFSRSSLLIMASNSRTDIVARLVAQRMSETIGQPVVVENRAGAAGTIAADAVAKAAPDGYTLLIHNVTFPMASVAAQVAGRATYNVDTDFSGVSIAVYVPLVITSALSVPGNNLRDVVLMLQKDRSLKYTYGSTGPGSFMHVIGEALSRQAGIEMTHIPYKGAAPLKQELLAGRIQLGGDQLSSSLADIKAGKIKALATNGSNRIRELPEVPTVRELGYPVLEAEGWNGFFTPARTPREVIDRLHREIAAAVRYPDIAKRFGEIGAEPVGSSPAEQDAILKRQVEQFRPVIREMRIEN